MQFIKTGAKPVPYKLVTYNRYREVLTEVPYSSVEELAIAARRNSWALQQHRSSIYLFSNVAVSQKAFSPKGRPLNVDELMAWAERLFAERYMRAYMRGYKWREGTVPGLHGWRGGPSTRPCKVQNERRLNGAVLREEGEIAARPSRCGFSLPDSWDGRPRSVERCWKSQRKGRKSWDRG